MSLRPYFIFNFFLQKIVVFIGILYLMRFVCKIDLKLRTKKERRLSYRSSIQPSGGHERKHFTHQRVSDTQIREITLYNTINHSTKENASIHSSTLHTWLLQINVCSCNYALREFYFSTSRAVSKHFTWFQNYFSLLAADVASVYPDLLVYMFKNFKECPELHQK